MITYTTVSNSEELKQILALQRANIPTAISSEDKLKEGFVTVHHDFNILKEMNDACPHIIAKCNDQVVGYALCMHPKFGEDIEVLKPMFTEINRVIDTTESWIVMGQVCIDKAFRKQGIFRSLYIRMLEEITPEFSTIITEVDTSNVRSLNAHYGIGFKQLATYKADGRNWELIYLKQP